MRSYRVGILRNAIVLGVMIIGIWAISTQGSVKADAPSVLDGVGNNMMTGVSVAPNDASHSSLGLDGNGACTAHVCDYSWEVLTTRLSNDIVIVFASCSDCQISDTAGLAYTFRAGVAQLEGGLSEYYAVTHEALESDNITVASSYMHSFAVHGVSRSIFDGSAFTSNCAYANSHNIPCTGSVSTSGKDFIYTGVFKPATSCDSLTGWTRISNTYLITSDYTLGQQPGTTDASYNCLHYNRIGPPNHSVLGLIVDAIALP